ncbi:MAG: hypothetical protein QXJ72_03925, partial [Thermoproteota archaeon]
TSKHYSKNRNSYFLYFYNSIKAKGELEVKNLYMRIGDILSSIVTGGEIKGFLIAAAVILLTLFVLPLLFWPTREVSLRRS